MKIGLGGFPAGDLSWIVETSQTTTTSLTGSRSLITGATGFVGRWVLAALLSLKRELGVTDMSLQILARNPKAARARLGEDLWRGVEVLPADIIAEWSLARPITHVVHGATPSSLRSGSGDARTVLLTSVLGTHNLIRALDKSGARARVLNLSSGAVYGPQPPDLTRIPEDWSGGPVPFSPSAPYAEGKRSAEALLEAAAREGILEPIHARLFAFLGPGLPTDEGFAIGNFARQASRGQTIEVLGDGSTLRSYLEARALASWLVQLLVAGFPGEPYNVGSPFGHSLRYWAEQCASISGGDIRYGTAPLGDRPAYVPDISNSAKLGIHLATDDPRPALESWIEWIKESPSHPAAT